MTQCIYVVAELLYVVYYSSVNYKQSHDVNVINFKTIILHDYNMDTYSKVYLQLIQNYQASTHCVNIQ